MENEKTIDKINDKLIELINVLEESNCEKSNEVGQAISDLYARIALIYS